MSAELTLALPWLSSVPEQLGDLVVRRGREDVLAYDDGVELAVRVLAPARYPTFDDLLAQAGQEIRPGVLVLVAGDVPVPWRSQLRHAGLSFVDVSGVVEIYWPRLRVSEARFGQPVKRRRSPMAFQKGHAVVVQELLLATVPGVRPTIGDLAAGAHVNISTASRAVSQLEEHGFVTKQRRAHQVEVAVVDRVELAELLSARTAWPGDETLGGYVWGRGSFGVADQISTNAAREGVELAVTGRVGAAFHGVLSTSSPAELRCWVDTRGQDLPEIAAELGLEPAGEDDVNVVLSADPWRLGLHRRRQASFDGWTAPVANPLRVWCDLHSELRGSEFAAQLWGIIADAR